MDIVVSIVLHLAGMAGALLAGLLVTWALARIAWSQSTARSTAGLLFAGVALAAAASWALMHGMRLEQTRQLVEVHERLMQLVATGVFARGAFEDLHAAAEPSAELDALRDRLDSHERSVAALLQAEWGYYRGIPWNERELLHSTTWAVQELLVHHARLRGVAPECAAAPRTDAAARLQDRLLRHRTIAGAFGEQFEGYDLDEQAADPANDAAILTMLAVLLAALSVLSAVGGALARRKRPRHPMDWLLAASALGLASLAAWMAFGEVAAQERMRARLFAQASVVYREALVLEREARALKAATLPATLRPGQLRASLVAEHDGYLNSLYGVSHVVQAWHRAVLTGALDASFVAPEPIDTHDGLLDAVRERTLVAHRQYLKLDRRLADLGCRSAWFERASGPSREERLVALPAAR